MATTNAGLVMVPINARLVGNEICYLLEDSEAARPDRPCGGHPRRSFACRDHYIHFGAALAPKGYRSYEDLIAAASARAPKMAVAPKDKWALIHTSATTGRSNGAMRSHQGFALHNLATL